jgi:hypothetical protein
MLANRRKDQLAVHQPMLDITRKNVIRWSNAKISWLSSIKWPKMEISPRRLPIGITPKLTKPHPFGPVLRVWSSKASHKTFNGLIYSLSLFVILGWWIVLIHNFVHVALTTARQNWLLKKGSRSETRDSGIPCKR